MRTTKLHKAIRKTTHCKFQPYDVLGKVKLKTVERSMIEGRGEMTGWTQKTFREVKAFCMIS